MKISVLMAAHHGDHQIADALASILAQTHSDWELLVVEYGPADTTRSLVLAFERQSGRPVTYFALGENHNAAVARNQLLELATGDCVAFLDPFDQWTPTHLTDAAVRLLEDADVVVSDVRVQGTPHSAPDVTPSAQLGVNPVRALFVANALPFVSATAFRRELATRAGLFDVQFYVTEAQDFWLRCALHGARFAMTARTTCHCTVASDYDLARTLRLADQRIQFYEKHRDLATVPAALRRHMLSSSLVWKGQLLRVSDPASAARHFLRAWTLQPMHVQSLGQLALLGRPLGASAVIESEGPIGHPPSAPLR
jgi:glycosyltransferase involved in cell wall biosynthesis